MMRDHWLFAARYEIRLPARWAAVAASRGLTTLDARRTICVQINSGCKCVGICGHQVSFEASANGVRSMMTARSFGFLACAGALAMSFGQMASAQETIKIGELNSYKSQTAFLDPYKKGWEMAIEEINAKGGVLGKKLEVISRDDGSNPGDAVRVADELVTREGVNILAGTFLSHIGLAVTEFAGKKQVFFLAAEPLTDKITWQNGNRYTCRLRSSTYMQVAMLVRAAIAAKKKRWALVYPNFEYGQ